VRNIVEPPNARQGRHRIGPFRQAWLNPLVWVAVGHNVSAVITPTSPDVITLFIGQELPEPPPPPPPPPPDEMLEAFKCAQTTVVINCACCGEPLLVQIDENGLVNVEHHEIPDPEPPPDPDCCAEDGIPF
jgi:hypothetical protein